MLKIGQYNTLVVNRHVDFGVYLDAGNGIEILLPARYISQPLAVGSEIDVFVYTDSEDRLIATTEQPLATVGQFAFLTVVEVSRIGAFLDWGLMKDLLVPFNQQKTRMIVGNTYPVYVYLDDSSKRVVASAKIEKFMGNVIPQYKRGDSVDILVLRQVPIGYACVVDNLHPGMIYENEIFCEVSSGQRLKAFVKRVRPDGKIDVTLSDKAATRTDVLAERILTHLTISGSPLEVDDKSSPDDISKLFQCSKRDFKQAIGHLLKSGKIVKTDSGLSLFAD